MAVETAFQEWELLHGAVAKQGGRVFPPVVFIYFNTELLRLISEGKLSPGAYQDLMRRYDELKQVVQAESDRRARQQ